MKTTPRKKTFTLADFQRWGYEGGKAGDPKKKACSHEHCVAAGTKGGLASALARAVAARKESVKAAGA